MVVWALSDECPINPALAAVSVQHQLDKKQNCFFSLFLLLSFI